MMRRVVWILAGVAMVAGPTSVTAWAHWAAHSKRSRLASCPDVGQDLDGTPQASNSDTSEEVVRLRAELRRKDVMLLSLTTTKKAEEETAAPGRGCEVVPPTSREPDPVTKTMDALDERLFTSPRDTHVARETERQLRETVSSLQLGEANVSSLYCSSALCKVTISASTGTGLSRAVSLLAERSAKAFGSAAVYESGKGQSALYLGKARQDVELGGAPSETPPQHLVLGESSKSTETSRHP